ncbi:hypothetical protein, partial [Aurantimonas sp. C2-4-R8]|nr:hypothetical protein [Aurantimonas sp. C2-4-R8]
EAIPGTEGHLGRERPQPPPIRLTPTLDVVGVGVKRIGTVHASDIGRLSTNIKHLFHSEK